MFSGRMSQAAVGAVPTILHILIAVTPGSGSCAKHATDCITSSATKPWVTSKFLIDISLANVVDVIGLPTLSGKGA